MRRYRWLGLAVVGLLLFASPLSAEDVTEKVGQATLNWSDKTLLFSGEGAVNLAAPSAASARVGAERAAQLDALRNALEVIKGVKLTASESADAQFKSKPGMKARVEGLVRCFIVQETHYYSDGGVRRDLRIPLDGVLGAALLGRDTDTTPPDCDKLGAAKPTPAPAAPTSAPAPTAPAPTAPVAYTGVVVVARGFTVIPVLAPKLIDEKGQDVYAAGMVTDATLTNGIVSYMKDAALAAKAPKVGANPLIVTALKAPNSVDLVLGEQEAQSLRRLAQTTPVLAQGRVVIVKD